MLRRAGRPEADTDRYLAFRVLSIIAAPVVALLAWSNDGLVGRDAAAWSCTALGVACCTVLPSRKLRAAGGVAGDRDPAAAARHHGPPRHLHGGRSRVHAPPCPARSPTSTASSPTSSPWRSARCAPAPAGPTRSTGSAERVQLPEVRVLRAVHPPGRPVRHLRVDGAPRPGRGHADHPPPDRPGEGAEGAGEDARSRWCSASSRRCSSWCIGPAGLSLTASGGF